MVLTGRALEAGLTPLFRLSHTMAPHFTRVVFLQPLEASPREGLRDGTAVDGMNWVPESLVSAVHSFLSGENFMPPV